MFDDVPPIEAPVVAIFYDAGETNALKSTFNTLDQHCIEYRIVALATAGEKAVTSGYLESKVLTQKHSFPNTTVIDPKTWQREDTLPKSDIEEIANKISKLNPKVIITGTVSKVQWQICEAIALKAGIQPENKLAYYDNLNALVENNPARVTVERFTQGDYTILVPSFPISKPINHSLKEVVGHPSLEEFARKITETDSIEVKQKLGYSCEAKVVTYVGGYGSEYEKSFEEFVRTMKSIEKNQTFSNLEILIQIHPKYDEIAQEELPEFKIIREHDLKHVTISQSLVKTEEALCIADLAISQASTVIPQAACAGIQAHFMNLSSFKNTMVDAGVCRNLTNAEAITQLLKCPEKTDPNAVFEKAGIPKNAAKNIFDRIQQSLSSTSHQEEPAISHAI